MMNFKLAWCLTMMIMIIPVWAFCNEPPSDFERWLDNASVELFGPSIGAKPDYSSIFFTVDKDIIERGCLPLSKLTSDEKVSIRAYVGEGYSLINKSLRSGDSSAHERIRPFTTVLSGALSRFPKKKGLVYRYTNIPLEVLKSYSIGKLVRFPEYLSTSADPKWVETGKSFGSVLFQIFTSNGNDISCISGKPEEKEWLLDKGSIFEIQSISQTPSGTVVINMVDKTLPLNVNPGYLQISFKKSLTITVWKNSSDGGFKIDNQETKSANEACRGTESCTFTIGQFNSVRPFSGSQEYQVSFGCFWEKDRVGSKFLSEIRSGEQITYSCPQDFYIQ